jgi:hypothetical protein
MTCKDCNVDYQGLSFAVHDDDWNLICPEDGTLCPWCASKRAAALGLTILTSLNLQLPGMDGTNWYAIQAFEGMDTKKVGKKP